MDGVKEIFSEKMSNGIKFRFSSQGVHNSLFVLLQPFFLRVLRRLVKRVTMVTGPSGRLDSKD